MIALVLWFDRRAVLRLSLFAWLVGSAAHRCLAQRTADLDCEGGVSSIVDGVACQDDWSDEINEVCADTLNNHPAPPSGAGSARIAMIEMPTRRARKLKIALERAGSRSTELAVVGLDESLDPSIVAFGSVTVRVQSLEVYSAPPVDRADLSPNTGRSQSLGAGK